jgi:hypothetical protein
MTIKYIIYKIKQKHTKHTTIYIYIYNDKKWNQRNVIKKSHISSKLHMIYIISNKGRHPVTKNFTPLHYASPNYTSLHFITLVDTLLPLI